LKPPAPPRASLRPPFPSKPDRRQAILLAAEKLFATTGYHGVSIRDIAEEAGVPLALVRYYYGQKHELFHAIHEHWSVTIGERLAMLKDALAQPGDKLLHLVEAFVAPVIRLRASPEGEYYALLMTRGLAMESPEEAPIIEEFYDPMAKAFIDGYHKVLSAEFDGVTRPLVCWCYQFALGALLHHIGDTRIERLSQRKNKAADPAAMPLLVAFIAEGIRGAVRSQRPAPQRSAKR
jgi:AcrR family transcriptional regulator